VNDLPNDRRPVQTPADVVKRLLDLEAADAGLRLKLADHAAERAKLLAALWVVVRMGERP
jgi:hypothetical protein